MLKQWVSLIMLIGALVACSAPTSQPPSPTAPIQIVTSTPLPTVIAPTATVPTATSSATTPPPTPIPPTAAATATPRPTQAATNSSGAKATRISFGTGETSASVNGALAARTTIQYIVGIEANQLLEVVLTPQEGLKTSIYGVDGTVLQSGMGEAVGFRGVVPTSQDYIIQVSSADQRVDYAMTVTIPKRVSFAAGSTSARFEGRLDAHQSIHYVAGARQGQQLQVTFTPASSAKMSIYGADGSVLWSGMGEGTSFTGDLPATQDYIIVFQAGTAPVNYELTISIK